MKRLIISLVIAVLVLGVCAPVFAANEVTTNENTVETTSEMKVGDYIGLGVIALVGFAFMFAAGSSDYTPKGLTHSNFTGVGRLNNAMDHYSKK